MRFALSESLALTGKRLLVVEDEYLIANDLAATLCDAGAEVIGPAASLQNAFQLLAGGATCDAAVLDINLRGQEVFPLAAEIRQRQVPILFLTGYGASSIPEEFANEARCEKPTDIANVVNRLASLLGPMTEAA